MAQQLNPDVTIIRYALKDPTQLQNKENTLEQVGELTPGEIYFDPKSNKYVVAYSDETTKSFGSYQQASINKSKL